MSQKRRMSPDLNFNVYVDKIINNAITVIVNYGEISVLTDIHRDSIIHVQIVTVGDSIIPCDSPSNR